MAEAGHLALTRRAFFTSAGVLGAGAGAVLVGAAPARARGRRWRDVPEPEIHGTDDWGARQPTSPVALAGNDPDKIIVHHTAFANTADSGTSGSYPVAREIQDLHMDTNGWIDSGQHFTVSRSGVVMEGRHRSLERLRAGSDMVVAAHTVGQNTQSIGIENNGTYTSVAPPQELYTSLVDLCAYVCGQYGLSPQEIYGHRDFNATECPGDRLYAMLPQLRGDVAARM
ncbi:peptidoglycan recognition protein family protein [Actinacidiphila guanduensis]|uniref:N-acetylmuramoyl-L-alanine amidase n=1 Tax=Actinacidiphila guanduensis TaxID=310781 RepID=A0A1H0A0J4_9ACTN|nr:peptidoglycan recognition family protein [Actinacidiphila guanduensis]SDN26463.1 N-acetylmuramoyl-L-alanine amidase [Actinacidiphila guanduensis]